MVVGYRLLDLPRRGRVRDPDPHPPGPAARDPGPACSRRKCEALDPRGRRRSACSSLLNSLLAGSRVRRPVPVNPYFVQIIISGRDQHHPRGQPEPDQRLHRAVLDRARGLHGGRRVRVRVPVDHDRRSDAAGALGCAGVACRRRRCCSSRSARGPLAAAIAGLLVGIPSLRLRGDYLAIVTLGFGEIIRVVILNIDAVGGARGLHRHPAASRTSSGSSPVAALTVVVVRNIVQLDASGARSLAIREDEIAAEAMGVNTTRYKVLAFVVSVRAGRHRRRSVRALPDVPAPEPFTFIKSFEIIIMIVLGGLGSITGVGARAPSSTSSSPRALAGVRAVPDGPLLAAPDRDHDRRPRGMLGHRELWSLFVRRRRVEPAPPAVTG